jgi:GDP-L-fucose synthase
MVHTILVTGKNGQLSREFQNILSNSDAYSDFRFIFAGRKHADLKDQGSTRNLLKEIKPFLIIHTAAQVGGIQFNLDKSYEMLLNNLNIDMNILNSALDEKVANFIYYSSSCMYPVNSKNPIKTADMFSGEFEKSNEYYAIAKSTISKLIEGIDRGHDVNYKCLVLSNLYGQFDNYSLDSSHLLAAALKKVEFAHRNKYEFVEVWGSGEPRREFTLAAEIADWTLNQLGGLENLPSILNLGAGVDYSVTDIYNIILDILDFKGNLVYRLDKPDGIKSKLMDSSVARGQFNWTPTEDLKLGINSFLNLVKWNS